MQCSQSSTKDASDEGTLLVSMRSCVHVVQKALSAFAHSYTPSWIKYRYGAWYLQPKLWKKLPMDEPLRDPKEPQNKEVSEAKAQSLRLVCTLLTLSMCPNVAL